LFEAEARWVMSPEQDKGAQERRFNSLAPDAPQPPDVPNAPRQPENASDDIAGRRRVASVVRRFATLLDPDPDRFNNRDFREGRYSTYPRTPGEELLNPDLQHHEKRFNLARQRAPSQVLLVIPGSSSAREPQASGSGSQTPRPDGAHHVRSDSGGSQSLGVPQFYPFTSVMSETTPPPSSLLFDNVPPRRVTFTDNIR